MKFVKDMNGLDVPISNEESKVYETVINKNYVEKSSLNSRDEQLAENMVRRGVLRKGALDGTMVYAKVKGRK